MPRLSLLIDLDRCIGCKSCEAACKQEHGLGPHEYRNRVLWLEDRNVPVVDYLTVTCQQCERPACLRACPVVPKAISKDLETGVVVVDETLCTGCGECVTACPYGAMGFDPVGHHAVKCDLCKDRRSRGETPACANACPGYAIRFGEHEDLKREAQTNDRSLVDHDDFLLGPGTIYLAADRPQELGHDTIPGNGRQIAGADVAGPALLRDPRSRKVLNTADVEAPYRTERSEREPDIIAPGACTICFNACPLKFRIKNGEVVGVTGNDEDPIFRGRVCPKSQTMLQLYNNRSRLQTPLKRVGARGNGRFVPITWDQALTEISQKLSSLRDKWGPETLGIFAGTRSGSLTKNGYIRLFTQLWGTPNVSGTDPFCSASKNLAYSLVQGNSLIANSYTPEDVGSAELFLYVGDNQAETRPVFFGMVNDWRKRTGAKMIVVDPRLSATASKADEWIAVRSGTDMALGLALIYHIFQQEIHDEIFCEAWIKGWQEWRAFVSDRGYSPEWAGPICGLSPSTIRRLAERVAAANGTMIFGSRGLNQHTNGVQTNRVFMFLAAITGNWGRRGGGFFNMAAHNYIAPDAPAHRRKASRPAAGHNPTSWFKAMTDHEPYPITALIACNNPFAHWPSQEKLKEAVSGLDLFVHIELFQNQTSAFADYVLPVSTGIEKGGISRSADDRRIVWNDKLIDPPGDARSDGWIWIEMGKRFGFEDVLKEEFKDPVVFWDEACRQNQHLRGITVQRLRSRPNRWLRLPMASEHAEEIETLYLEDQPFRHADGRNRFATPSGKLEFWTAEQDAKFAACGLSALPEFYSEREQPIPLPYVQPDDEAETSALSPFFGSKYMRRQRLVRPNDEESHPGTALMNAGFDTQLITGRPPAPHFHSWTHYSWQAQEMWPDLFVQIHPDKAAEIGISDGDPVDIETTGGAIAARAWVRPGIRPDTVFVPIGWDEHQPMNPWKSVNILSDYAQRDPASDQANLKTRMCRLRRARHP